ncbi:MAG: hypothetical protein Q9205_006673 [Flavoplaca limonia]
MKPLRLKIVVQPRVSSSPAHPALSEPPIKWLEVCNGDPTIQELSEILEKRFYQRNHISLNIKILKFLDDVELFPDCKVRDIFEDIGNIKQGDTDLSVVKVYRNPPTVNELADPRRFDSLPPDSFARPIKRPPSPYLCPPPPPLFADAPRNELRTSFEAPLPQISQFQDRSQTPNKRRKIETYDTIAYPNDPDRPIDSREVADHGYTYSHLPSQHPSQDPQIADSQTSSRKKRSDPYGTPISSQVSQPENGISHEVGIVSVPDSPPGRMIAHDRESFRPSVANSDSRSRSPELPSSTRRSQMQEATTEVQATNHVQRSRPLHKTPVASQAKLSARPSVDRKEVSSPRYPELLSQSEPREATRRSELPSEEEQGSEVTRTAYKASRMGSSELPSEVFTTSEAGSASRALPRSGRQIDLPPKSHGESEKGVRLKRPTVSKSMLAAKGTPKIINGIRQKAPSITDVFDPIETSEGSSYERHLPRSLKRAKMTVPKRNLRKAAPQKAASKNSLIVRLRLPKNTEPSSTTVPLIEASHSPMNAQGSASRSSTQESRSTVENREDQNSSIQMSALSAAGGPADHSSQLENSTAASNAQAQNFIEAAKVGPTLASPGRVHQRNSVASFIHPEVDLPNEQTVANARFALDKGEEIGDKSSAQQPEEDREVLEKAKAQAEFDRITALQKKRQGLQGSKASPSMPESSGMQTITKEPTSSTMSLLDEAKRFYGNGDLEAKRKYGLEQIEAAKNKYFKDAPAGKSSTTIARTERSTSTKPDNTAAQAEAKMKRKAKEQKDRELRMVVAEKLEKKRRKEAMDDKELAKLGNEKESPAARQRTEDVKPLRRNRDNVNQVTPLPSNREERRSQDTPRQTPESQRKEDSVEVTAEAVTAKRAAEKSVSPVEQAISDSSRIKLAERSPKARLNAQRQLQIANSALKYSNYGLGFVKTPASTATHSVAKSSTRAPRTHQNTNVKQAAMMTHNETRQSTGPRKSEPGTSTYDSDDLARTKTQASGFSKATKSTTLPSKGSGTAIVSSGTPKATTVDPAAGELTRYSTESSRRSSSSSLVRKEPSRARTMTPMIPSSSNKHHSESAEARAPRAGSVSAQNFKTPTRSSLSSKASASRRSVSFGGESVISQSQNGKTVDQQSTPTPSEQSSQAGRMAKTSEKMKQTTMNQHVDRKLKGKMIDPPSPVRTPVEKEIVISSESEASTFFSDESEGERNAKAGPSSRRKPKPRKTPSLSANVASSSKTGSIHSTATRTNLHSAARNSNGDSSQETSQPAKAPINKVVKTDNTKSSLSKSRSVTESESESSSRTSRSASLISTDDISNLPQIGGAKQAQSDPLAQSKKKTASQISTPRSGDFNVSSMRKGDEERLQLEANEQLQREYSQSMQKETTTDVESSEVEKSKKGIKPIRQTTQPADRGGREKYGSRVRMNPTYESLSLSQLKKTQAAEPRSFDKSTKRAASPKFTDQPSGESSSGSDSEDSSTSGSVDLSQYAHGGATPQKKRVLPSVWRDLYGREASGKKH